MRMRTAAAVAFLMLFSTACGARLTDRERALGIGVRGAGGQAGTALGTPTANATATGAGGGPLGTGTNAGGGGGVAPGQPGAVACGNPSTNPASDVGVTKNEVRIATASDITGVQPGLFKSTHQAISAFTAMVNSQGGICGRAVKPKLLDTKADSTANAAAVREACDTQFALVGSMSAFDNGGASTGEDCGIPDLSAITVNPSRQLAKNVYAAFPQRPDKLATGTANYIKSKYPEAIKHAAMVYLNAGVTKANAYQRIEGYESVGFDFGGAGRSRVYEVQVLEANYSPFVQKMKDAGVQYVNMIANYQSIQKLLQAMEQNEFFPKVRDWDSVAYSPNFVKYNGRNFTAADGSLVFLTTATSEEAGSNPEMQLYMSWLNRVAPGAKPDFFGFYAWSAARLFQKLATEIGPRLTRKALFAAVKNVHHWTGNGIHVDHDVGGKLSSPCFLYLAIRSSRFQRIHPSSGFECGMGGLVNT
jgi:ABC-type branched-subunit amino acid transport system substrate-binding protein